MPQMGYNPGAVPPTSGISAACAATEQGSWLSEGDGSVLEPYKILMIAPTSFFSDYGCSVRILEEARVLQRLGHDLVVCTYRNGQDVPGLQIRRTPGIPFREQYEVGSSLHKLGFDFLLFWTVLRCALRRRPDVIHAHMHEGALIGLAVSRLLRIPLVFDLQGSLTGEMLDHRFLRKDSIFYRPLRRLEKAINQRSPLILTSSANARDMLVTDFDCCPDRIQPVPDCVDTATFYPPVEEEGAALAGVRAQLGVPPGKRIVAYLGLLAHYQGTDLLLRAASQVTAQRDDVHFLIMGFPAVEHYRQLADDLGVSRHITFTGKVPYDQARGFLALGDVAVAPKLSATEGCGKILNYMAMGLPVVAFDTPVSREYLGAQGIYARPGDADALAQALLAALDGNHRAQAAQLRQIAARCYSWDQAAGAILQAYSAVCRRPATVL
jgi:glycosyltransferase involved in cell wall biosynthesis